MAGTQKTNCRAIQRKPRMSPSTGIDDHQSTSLVGVPWACPECREGLSSSFACEGCGMQVPVLADGRPDFRIRAPTKLSHVWDYDPTFGRFPWDRASTAWPDAGHEVRGSASWDSIERYMIRAMPLARTSDPKPFALDIGCGENRQRFRDGLTALGYRPLGFDIAGSAPDALADAHRLPLQDASIDLIVTSAVWEHLKHPHVAMSEVGRIAKPGGRFIGSIA